MLCNNNDDIIAYLDALIEYKKIVGGTRNLKMTVILTQKQLIPFSDILQADLQLLLN
jgi:hypothetical protein